MMWSTKLYGKKVLILCKFNLQIRLSETSGGFAVRFRSFFSILNYYNCQIVLPGFYFSLEKY